MVSEGFISLIKYFLFLFNLLFFFLGMLLFSVGLWIIIDEESLLGLSVSSMPFSPFGYFLMIGGSITMFLGFFGCCGALKEVKCMLAMYFFLLTILLALEIIATVICVTQKTMIQTKVEEQMLQLIKSYEHQPKMQNFRTILGYVQEEANCCGWNGPSDWASEKMPCSCYSSFNNIPDNSSMATAHTCNETVLKNCDHLDFSNATCWVIQEGCKQHFEEWVADNMMVVLGVLLAVMFTEFTGMALSMSLYKSIIFDYCAPIRLSGFRDRLGEDTS